MQRKQAIIRNHNTGVTDYVRKDRHVPEPTVESDQT